MSNARALLLLAAPLLFGACAGAFRRAQSLPDCPSGTELAQTQHRAGVGCYRDGVPDGPFVFFDDQAHVIARTTFHDGVMNGRIVTYYPDGHVRFTTAVRKGKLEGRLVVYRDDGSIEKIATHHHGVLDGPYEERRADGSPVMRGRYSRGLQQGTWSYWSARGARPRTFRFEHGHVVIPPPEPPRTPAPPKPPPQLDPDGNDETAALDIALPEHGHFEKVGRHWAALTRVCDFAVKGGALYMAHATRPLGYGGATLTRYVPGNKRPFSLSFDWNREHEPQKGGGGGQGFLRIRDIGGRLYVPDADPPYLGLGLVAGVEGYVFESDPSGAFAPPRRPHHLPPAFPTKSRAGAIVLPGAIHDFDVIRYRGKLYASTSAAIPPKATARSSPGTLFTPGDKPGRWRVAYTYAGAPGEASVRLGYMTRFRDRLYVAVSPLYGLDRHDFVVFKPPRDATAISAKYATAVQVTKSGGANTLRWYTDHGRLYWVTIGADGGQLRVTKDGDAFRLLALPPGAGRPSDVLRVGKHLLVLAEHGLYELSDGSFRLLAPVPGKSIFKVDDAYCAPPLVVFDGALYAGGQHRGALWRLSAD